MSDPFLRFTNDNNQHVSGLSVDILSRTTWRIPFKIAIPSSMDYFDKIVILGRDNNNQASITIQKGGSNNTQFTINVRTRGGRNSTDFTEDFDAAIVDGNPHDYVLTRDGDSRTCTIDENDFGGTQTQSEVATNESNCLGRSGSTYTVAYDLYVLEGYDAANGGNRLFNLDPNLSNGIGLVLYDSESSNNGALNNFSNDDSHWISDGSASNSEQKSDIWAFDSGAAIAFSGQKSATGSVILEQSVILDFQGIKHSADPLNFETSSDLQFDGFKNADDAIRIISAASIDIDGTKVAGADWLIYSSVDLALRGIKHASGGSGVSVFALINWQGSSEVTRLGEFTISSAVGLSFGGIKHASNTFKIDATASATINGIKLAPGAFAITSDVSIRINALKHSTGEFTFSALSAFTWSGNSNDTPARFVNISLQGVLQTTQIKGELRSINLKGYL